MEATEYAEDKLARTHRRRRANLWSLFAALIVALIVGGAVFQWAWVRADSVAAAALADSTVKIVLKDGWGSGVDIGDGYVLTAGHVAQGLKTADVKTSKGDHVKADVLWVNADYDLALLRLPANVPVAASQLNCRPLTTGQHISAEGNPITLEFVKTDGIVAGAARAVDPWKIVVPVAMPMIPGMSGGPAFNDAGEVVGINVGTQLVPLAFGASLSGIGFIVPATAACALIGRA